MADQWWMGYLVHVVRLGFIYTCNMIAKNHPCALDGCVNRGGDWRQRCGSDICVCVSVCVSGACVSGWGGWVGRSGWTPRGCWVGCVCGGGRSFVERSFFFSFTFSVSSCELPMGASRVCEP